ncbi:MAG: group I truncated hemoglobin [Nannocystaceae bacterium]
MSESIYEKYGFGAISKVVHDFYGRVLKSPITAPYFANYNVERIINHQTQFLCSLVGGPATYEGRELKLAHRNLKITNEAFDEVGELLDETLEDHGLLDGEREQIMTAVHNARDLIVTA